MRATRVVFGVLSGTRRGDARSLAAGRDQTVALLDMVWVAAERERVAAARRSVGEGRSQRSRCRLRSRYTLLQSPRRHSRHRLSNSTCPSKIMRVSRSQRSRCRLRRCYTLHQSPRRHRGHRLGNGTCPSRQLSQAAMEMVGVAAKREGVAAVRERVAAARRSVGEGRSQRSRCRLRTS